MGVKAYVVDIETSPLVVRTWSMWNANIQPDNIIEDRRILCIGWKEVGGATTHSASVGPNVSEREMLDHFRAAIDDADILIGHNLASFDMKHLTAKFIEHAIEPLQKHHVIDTLREIKRVAKFSSNRLDFLCGKLLGDRKLKTDMDLWVACMAGDEKALARMARYCRHDVDMTEALYLRIRGYIRSHPNVADTNSTNCPRCGHGLARMRKEYRTKAGAVRTHMHCLACSAPFTIAAGAKRPLSAV